MSLLLALLSLACEAAQRAEAPHSPEAAAMPSNEAENREVTAEPAPEAAAKV